MKLVASLVVLVSLAATSGCGSLLSAMGSEPIVEDPGVRTTAAKLDDESIETKAKVNISAADPALRDSHFSVVSYNGYVLLVGQTPSQAMKDKASEVLKTVRGVRRIYNELEIIGNTSGITRSSDAWLTSKVKAALLASSQIEGTRVKVVTENGIVYLMGLARRAEAERIAEKASATYGVQKVVRLFEYID